MCVNLLVAKSGVGGTCHLTDTQLKYASATFCSGHFFEGLRRMARPNYMLPLKLGFTVVEKMNQKTRDYDSFMSIAHNDLQHRKYDSLLVLEYVVMRTLCYNIALSETDSMALTAKTYCGKKVLVFACALRRMGMRMSMLSTLLQHVRVIHLRKHSAYKDFAGKCSRVLLVVRPIASSTSVYVRDCKGLHFS